ncbi:MAG TPA: potassium-transporting ATPase subunit KdpC [Rhodanobacteraceae bacterium]|nr:potassium-transporting ATPase subunit KdpC [Rhodanobacteraceae bacterium]
MFALFKSAAILFVLMTAISGFVYPLAVYGIAQAAFPKQANGSLIERDGHTIGSALIGQQFDAAKYFQGRPSATTPAPYNAMASGGSNLGPSNPALIDAVEQRIVALRKANPDAQDPIPSELVTASASGLDPDISPQAALWQAPRVARAHGLPLARVRALIDAHAQAPSLGVFGEPRVNVLQLNLALDDAQGAAAHNARR